MCSWFIIPSWIKPRKGVSSICHAEISTELSIDGSSIFFEIRIPRQFIFKEHSVVVFFGLTNDLLIIGARYPTTWTGRKILKSIPRYGRILYTFGALKLSGKRLPFFSLIYSKTSIAFCQFDVPHFGGKQIPIWNGLSKKIWTSLNKGSFKRTYPPDGCHILSSKWTRFWSSWNYF